MRKRHFNLCGKFDYYNCILLTNFETTNPNFHKYFSYSKTNLMIVHITIECLHPIFHGLITGISGYSNNKNWRYKKVALKSSRYTYYLIKMQDYVPIYLNKISFELRNLSHPATYVMLSWIESGTGMNNTIS